jgi:hypothetical protein
MALSDNLVAYYKLDESSGNASDSVGSRTLTNTNTVSYATAKINNGADFGASNADKRLLYTTDSYGITTGAITLTGWVKMNTEISSGNPRFFEHRYGASGIANYVEYNYNGGTRQIRIGRDISGVNINTVNSTVTLGTTNWYHFAMAFDGSTIEGYINGSSIGTVGSTQTGSTTSDGFCIGATVNGFLFASAVVDEVGMWNRRLSSDDVSKIYNAGRGNQYPFTDDLTTSIDHYYKFEGNSNDAVGSANGTDTSITYSTANGKIEQGAGFNAQTDKIQTTITTGLSGSFTCAGWVNSTDTNGIENAFVYSHASAQNNYWFYGSIGGQRKLRFALYDGTNNPNIVGGTDLSDNTWYHVAFVRDTVADTIKVYLNGALDATAVTDSTTTIPVYSDFGLGCRTNNNTAVAGAIDEIGIWSRALTTTEISSLYNSGNGLQYPFSTTSIKTINGLAKASVKTVNGLAIASVKTINGLS